MSMHETVINAIQWPAIFIGGVQAWSHWKSNNRETDYNKGDTYIQ